MWYVKRTWKVKYNIKSTLDLAEGKNSFGEHALVELALSDHKIEIVVDTFYNDCIHIKTGLGYNAAASIVYIYTYFPSLDICRAWWVKWAASTSSPHSANGFRAWFLSSKYLDFNENNISFRVK